MVDELSKPHGIKIPPRAMIDLRYTSTAITAIMISLICSLHHVSQQDEKQLEDVEQLLAPTLALLCVAGFYFLFVLSNACCDEEQGS